MATNVLTLPAPEELPRVREPLSAGRVVTDVMLGVLVPLLCLVFDPIVFRGDGRLGGLLASYAIVGYLAAGLGMVTLLLWLILGRMPGLFAGLLAGEAVFAACVGVVLFPLSFLTLLMGIGLLGLTPLFTALVFGRNAREAWRLACGRSPRWAKVSAACGFLFACGGPWAAHGYVRYEVSCAIDLVASGDPADVQRGVDSLRRLHFAFSEKYDELVWRYRSEPSDRRKKALAEAYSQLTGDDIEYRLRVLLD
jgi:hypothetical protein